jgi:hypothetical protein
VLLVLSTLRQRGMRFDDWYCDCKQCWDPWPECELCCLRRRLGMMTTSLVTLLVTALGITPLSAPHFFEDSCRPRCVIMCLLFRPTRLCGRCDTSDVAAGWLVMRKRVLVWGVCVICGDVLHSSSTHLPYPPWHGTFSFSGTFFATV